MAATGLDGHETVEVNGERRTLREALIRSYDICRVTPDLPRFVAENCADPGAAKVLRAPTDRLTSWLAGRNGLDIVEEFTVRADPAQWQDVPVRLTSRNYSISSSPLVSPHEVQLTVSVVRYRGRRGAARGGVCSTYLADRAHTAPVFLQRSPHFRPPKDPAAAMIMVGPGTGIAPFRGFLQERRALGHTGRNWLFFGEQRRSENFYYRDDFEDMVSDGFLTRLDLAFSRDQKDRVYVQHEMLDYGADLWRWLDEGAHFYVCGDATRMARDVDAVLTSIIKTHGGMSDEQAHNFKRELVADGGKTVTMTSTVVVHRVVDKRLRIAASVATASLSAQGSMRLKNAMNEDHGDDTKVQCVQDRIGVGDTTTCSTSFTAPASEIWNSHWVIYGMDVGAWPSQIVATP